MGWKKLTVIVVAAAALVGGALSLSMYLTRQQELEMEVADEKPQPPQAGDTTTLADMENMPIYTMMKKFCFCLSEMWWKVWAAVLPGIVRKKPQRFLFMERNCF